ncbi:MAG: HAD family hydrolase [Candidatus Aenigmarchaeota archaeon]|nr:HAD family hydrolase [Candidatus Aenigmarchaeota archaeon]
MIKAVIFDLWGTTLYSSGDFGTSALKLLGISHSDEKKFWEALEKHWMRRQFESVEQAAEHALARTFNIRDKEKIRQFALLYREDRKFVKPFDDVFPVIKKLRKRFKIGLLSNTDCFTAPILQKIGFLDLFDVALLSCDHNQLKPDKALFRRMLKSLGVRPEEAVMIGDTIRADIIPARQLGMKAIFIDRRNKHPKIREKITTLKGLEKILEKM